MTVYTETIFGLLSCHNLLPHLLQKISSLTADVPHLLQLREDISEASAPVLAVKYLFIMLPFIPMIDAVLIIRSAIAMEGGLFVTMDINCVKAKTPPQTTRYQTELRDMICPFSIYIRVERDQTMPRKRPTVPIAPRSHTDGW